MTIIYIAVLWCLGIWTAAHTGGIPTLWIGGVVATTVLALLFRERRGILIAMVCLTSFCAGGLRTSISHTHINVDHFSFSGNDPEVTVIGTIIEQPRVRDTRIDVTLQVESLHGVGESARIVMGRLLVRAPRYPVLEYGERIRVTGTPQRIRNWNEFDYREYLARQNIFYEMANPQIARLERGAGGALYQALHALRERARAAISLLFPDPERSLLIGILLGDDGGMPAALRADFRVTGMSHIIAISGFNIAILAGALLRAGRRLPGLRTSGWVAMGGVAIYTLFVGAEAAVVRAAVMGSLYIFSNRVLGRPAFAPAGLFVAALLMSLFNPYVLWEIGFQLSFAATLGLMLFVEPFSHYLRDWLAERLPGERIARLMPVFTEIVIVTIAAQIMTLPLLAYHFGEISLVSLLANLLILPAQPGVMLFGGLATMAGILSPVLAQPLSWIAWLHLAYTTRLVELLAQLPFAATALQPDPFTVALAYALLLGAYWLARQKQERRQTLLLELRGRAAHGTPLLLVLSLGLTLIWSRTLPDGRLHVAFLDVGQGDAIFIQTPGGRQLLVDGGQYPSVLKSELGRQMPFWDRHLDIVVATHPDDDHVAGLPELFERYEAPLLLINGAEAGTSRAYSQLLQEAAAHGVIVRTPVAGERLHIGDGVHIIFLHPGAVPLATDNDNSIALLLTYGDFSLLLTGDAELEAERAMVASGLPLRALVLKAGHHGSSSSSNAFFLDRVRPQIVVISAGADNRFGHPHAEVLERAAAVGAAVLRTDELGTIEVVTDGDKMWWQARR